eukprot:scaffold1107_cov185-Pinguiococcus_pyrenoidosus.AAC.2
MAASADCRRTQPPPALAEVPDYGRSETVLVPQVGLPLALALAVPDGMASLRGVAHRHRMPSLPEGRPPAEAPQEALPLTLLPCRLPKP